MEEYFTDSLLPVAEGEESQTSSSSQPLSSTGCGLRHSKHLEALHQLHYINKFEQSYPDSLEFMHYCLQAEVENPESDMNPSDFLPTPEHWKQILRLPARVKQAWLNTMY